MRDDFTQSVKDTLAKRVGCRCSNPSCQKLTNGPHEDSSKAVNIGVAAHITAAAPGGPRYDSSLSSEQRKSIENGIWLCQNCGKRIDSNPQKFPTALLMDWKRQAEEWADCEIGNSSPVISRQDASGLARYLDDMVNAAPVWWLPEINESTWYEFELWTKIWDESKKRDRKPEDAKPKSLEDAIAASEAPSILITGDPGAGKSTFLEHLAARTARTALDNSNSKIPVLIQLKIYGASSEFSGFKGLIYLAFESYLSPETVDQLLQQRRLLLLIDGWNELSDESAKSVVKRICQPHSIVATSRNASDYPEIRDTFEIQPLSHDDVQNFFDARLCDANQQDLKKLVNRVKDFGQTPLMVWMLFSIFKDDGYIPETRGEAYRVFTGIYVKHAKACINLSNARELLGKLAFEMMKSPNPKEPIEFRLNISELQAENVLGSDINLNRMLNHLLKQRGRVGNREISFCHQSLQEYYAAEHLLAEIDTHPEWLEKNGKEEYSWFQINYLNYQKWTEPIALLLGLPEVNEKLAIDIVEQALGVDLMLGARLAGEVRSNVQYQTVRSLAQILHHDNFTPKLQCSFFEKTRSDEAISYLEKLASIPGMEFHVFCTLNRMNTEKAQFKKMHIVEKNRKLQKFVYSLTTQKTWDENKEIIQKMSSVSINAAKSSREIECIINNLMLDYDLQEIPIKLIEDELSDKESFILIPIVLMQKYGENSFPALLKLMTHPDVEMRISVVFAFGRLNIKNMKYSDQEIIFSKLLDCSKESDIGICIESIKTMRSLSFNMPADQFNILHDRLLEVLNSSEIEVARAALEALCTLGSKDIIPLLFESIKLCNSGPNDIATASFAADNLAKIPGNTAADILPDLQILLQTQSGEQALLAAQGIQANCKFYDYGIYEKALARSTSAKQQFPSGSTIVHVQGDYIAGDKVQGDKVLGNKTDAPNAIEVKIFEKIDNYHASPPRDPP